MQDTNTKTYKCAECDMSYKDEDMAKKCEAWCKEHHTCNIDITKNAIKEDKNEHSCGCCN